MVQFCLSEFDRKWNQEEVKQLWWDHRMMKKLSIGSNLWCWACQVNKQSNKIHERFFEIIYLISGAGKTALLTRLIRNEFSQTLTISVGAIFHTQTLNIDDEIIKLDSKYFASLWIYVSEFDFFFLCLE